MLNDKHFAHPSPLATRVDCTAEEFRPWLQDVGTMATKLLITVIPLYVRAGVPAWFVAALPSALRQDSELVISAWDAGLSPEYAALLTD